MKTKEEVIREVYKHLFNSKKIDKNGWYNNRDLKIKIHHCDFLGEFDYKDKYFFRPKSLQGIEDNNGWIAIRSEEDLPEEDCDCHIVFEDGSSSIDVFKKEGGFIRNSWRHITFYQPITKPKQPLYD